jgi:predicted enzyme related to lactoylglutathione lyase
MVAFDTLSEVILYAQDIDRLTSFYADVFGLSFVDGAPEHGFVRFDTGECDLCLHAGADGDRGRDAPKVVFEVDDVEDARAYLLDHGVEVGAVRSPAPGTTVCDGVDPEGNAFSVETSIEP